MSNYDSQKDRFLNEVAALLNVKPDQLTYDLALNGDNWDSLATLSAIALVDQQFGITVATDDLVACRSAGEFIDLVRAAVERGGTGSD